MKYLNQLKNKFILPSFFCVACACPLWAATPTVTNTFTLTLTPTSTPTPNPTDEWPLFKNNAAFSSVNPADPLLPPFTLKWSSGVTVGALNTVSYSSPVVLDGQTYIGAIDVTLYAFNGTGVAP